MVFFIQGRRLETLVQDPGGDTLFCPLKTMPGATLSRPRVPQGHEGEELSQLDSWSCPHRKTPRRYGSLQGLHRSTGQDTASASLHPGGSSVSSPRSLICSTGDIAGPFGFGLVSKDTEAGVQADLSMKDEAITQFRCAPQCRSLHRTQGAGSILPSRLFHSWARL